jgi:hypothetical protein
MGQQKPPSTMIWMEDREVKARHQQYSIAGSFLRPDYEEQFQDPSLGSFCSRIHIAGDDGNIVMED